MAGLDGSADGDDESQQRCDDTEHHREELSSIGATLFSGGLVYPFHASVAEPHLSVLSVDEIVCGVSESFSERKIGMGGKDGAGEESQGGIDRHPSNEGGSEGDDGKTVIKTVKTFVD